MLDELQRINATINRDVVYKRDNKDHWQTPEETLTCETGDCEDYAILKMATVLLLEGLGEDDVRLLYCKHCDERRQIDVAHMVLEVWVGETPYLLDNLMPGVYPREQRPDIKPLLSFNAHSLWMGDEFTGKDPQQRLGRWKQVLDRATSEKTQLGQL